MGSIIGFMMWAEFLLLVWCFIGPSPVPFTIAAAVAGYAWFLARHQQGAESVNLMGTTFIGRRRTPAGHIATKWLIMLGVPLLPVGSYEVLYTGATTEHVAPIGSSWTTGLGVRPLPGRAMFHWPQVAVQWLIAWGTIAALLYALHHSYGCYLRHHAFFCLK